MKNVQIRKRSKTSTPYHVVFRSKTFGKYKSYRLAWQHAEVLNHMDEIRSRGVKALCQ